MLISRLLGFCFSLALVFLLAVLTACGPREDAPVRLTMAAALLPTEQVKYQEVLAQFTEQTGIQVDLVAQQYEPIRTAVQAEAMAGRGQLDVVELDLYQLPLLHEQMQPLAPLLGEEVCTQLAASVPEQAWAVGSPAGELKFVPHRLNWQALLYDAQALEQPPANWEALLDVAREHPGAIGLKCAQYEGMVCDLFPFLWQAGGDPLEPDTPQNLKALEMLGQLSAGFNPAVRSYKENTALQALQHREIVLHMNWPFAVSQLKDKGLLPKVFRTAPLPAGPDGRATVLGGGYLGVPATAPHPAQAAQLIAFLTSASAQRELVARLGWFPIRAEGWDALSEQDKQLYSGFMAMQQNVKARPNVPYYEKLSELWQAAFSAVLFEQADPAATLKELGAQVNPLKQEGPQ